VESLACAEDAGKSANPPIAYARTHRDKPLFVQVTLDQLAIPEPPRGAVADGEHLTKREKQVLCGLLKWCWGGRLCTASDLEIADAIGLTGSNAARKRMIQIALHGRTRDGIKYPGMADPERGWITILPDGNPRTGRAIDVSPKYRNWMRIRVHRESNHPAGSEPGLTTPTSSGSLPPRARAHYPSEPELAVLSKDSKDSGRLPEAFNVGGPFGPNTQGGPITIALPTTAIEPPSTLVNEPAHPDAELVETLRRWANDPGNPCRDLARAGLARLNVDTATLPVVITVPEARPVSIGAGVTVSVAPTPDLPPPQEDIASDLSNPDEAPPSVEILVDVLGTHYAGLGREAQADRMVELLKRRGWRLELRVDGQIEIKGRHGAGDRPSDEELRVMRWRKPEITAILARARAAAQAKEAIQPTKAMRGKPAPRVRNQAGIRAMIGRIPGAADDSLSRQVAGLLAGPTAFNDRGDPERSQRTYYGLFEALRSGRDSVTEDCLQQAFEAACGRSCRNRGAVFIDRVQALIGEQRAAKRASRLTGHFGSLRSLAGASLEAMMTIGGRA
jgi:hypothetical protein